MKIIKKYNIEMTFFWNTTIYIYLYIEYIYIYQSPELLTPHPQLQLRGPRHQQFSHRLNFMCPTRYRDILNPPTNTSPLISPSPNTPLLFPSLPFTHTIPPTYN